VNPLGCPVGISLAPEPAARTGCSPPAGAGRGHGRYAKPQREVIADEVANGSWEGASSRLHSISPTWTPGRAPATALSD
jgi:hypothetical protein